MSISARKYRYLPGFKQRSQYSVEVSQGFKQVKFQLNSVSTYMQNIGESSQKSFSLQDLPVTFNLCFLKSRLIQQGERCFQDVMISHKRICFPSFLSNRPCIEQTFYLSDNIDSINSSMTKKSLYLWLLRLSIWNASVFSPNQNFLEHLTQEPHFLVGKGSLQVLA